MRATNVHLEDVARAARQGLTLSVAVSLLALGALLVAGVSPLIAAICAIALLALGSASGGFGLVAWIALRAPRPRRAPVVRTGTVPPVQIPQTR
jgi:hypothetical protein